MKEKRNEKVEAKLTKSEHAQVLKMASDNNMSIAEFVRARVLHDPISKYSLFELRAMKILSSCAALIQVKVDELPEEKFNEFKEVLTQIKEKNEVEEVLEDNNLNEHLQ